MTTDRIDAHLPTPLAVHVAQLVGPNGAFETPEEYVRDLIRRDMEHRDVQGIASSIREGYRDIAAGRYFKSSGDFREDLKTFEEKERAGWV